MTIATTEEQRAVQESVRAWARSVDPVATVRQGPADSWRSSWESFAKLGIFSVAVPEEVGGSGAEIVDLAAMLEQSAIELAPGPVLTTALAALVVGRSGGPAAKQWSEELAEGARPCGVVVDGPALSAERSADGGLTLTGRTGPVLGAQERVSILVPADAGDGVVWCLVDGGADGLTHIAADSIDKSRAFGNVECSGVTVAANGVVEGVREGLVRDLAATLAAAEASGIASWCLRTAVEYAKIREQFGKPIGSFQAIKHLCADMLCRVEQTGATAWDAAVAAEDAWANDSEVGIAAAVAATVSLDAAVETAKDCIQVLGGIGFTWEHEAHFYLRRATSLRQLLGGSPRWRARVAELTRAGVRRHLSIDLSDLDSERADIRAEIAELVARPESERRAALADTGYLAPHWPAPYGRGAKAAQQILIEEELAAVGVSRPDLVIGWWAVPTILEHGSPEQIEKFATPTLRGEIVWCQLFSEPGAGSDLAALRTTAERVDGGWKLQGQKVWTSKAQEADWAICLARTDREAPKHKGISYFLVDMKTPGITIKPLREITGDSLFNEVYLDGVFVSDDLLVGNLGDGWKLARTTLANERVAMSGGSSLGGAMEELLKLAGDSDPVTDDKLGTLISNALVGSLLELRTTLRRLDGQDPGPASSVQKLVGVRQRQSVAEFAMDLAGPDGWVEGPLSYEFFNTRCLSIAGGTTQILLTVAAERILGLPRS
ncbi:acyl-CoA dehydrogenase [Rhodococcus sp. NPDC058521]|uniref:acyl-CoA dehydrogenase n=1 Tax=Rhodococcus sp. NPDC058521 TaxID=3346536 RepID=UPI00364FFF2C